MQSGFDSIRNSLNDLLKDGLQKMDLDVSEEKRDKLISYVELLVKWNAVHNLTAVRDPKEMVHRHILDSLTLLPALTSAKKIIDVGTGAGLPGIPLAITKPDINLVLLDSNQKKINFVQHVISSLKLSNVLAVGARVEQYKPEASFDWVISRAYASLSDFINSTAHLADLNGRWLAMKGRIQEEELAALPKGYTIEQVQKVSLPDDSSERCLVIVKKDLEEGKKR